MGKWKHWRILTYFLTLAMCFVGKSFLVQSSMRAMTKAAEELSSHTIFKAQGVEALTLIWFWMCFDSGSTEDSGMNHSPMLPSSHGTHAWTPVWIGQ